MYIDAEHRKSPEEIQAEMNMEAEKWFAKIELRLPGFSIGDVLQIAPMHFMRLETREQKSGCLEHIFLGLLFVAFISGAHDAVNQFYRDGDVLGFIKKLPPNPLHDWFIEHFTVMCFTQEEAEQFASMTIYNFGHVCFPSFLVCQFEAEINARVEEGRVRDLHESVRFMTNFLDESREERDDDLLRVISVYSWLEMNFGKDIELIKKMHLAETFDELWDYWKVLRSYFASSINKEFHGKADKHVLSLDEDRKSRMMRIIKEQCANAEINKHYFLDSAGRYFCQKWVSEHELYSKYLQMSEHNSVLEPAKKEGHNQ